VWYSVQSGDSLYLIARKFGVTVQQLKTANQLYDNTIYIGQLLFIPINVSKVITYTVQPGDSLYLIANRYNTTIDSISTLNDLTSNTIYVGQKLIIPQYTEAVVNVAAANIRRGPGTNYSIVQTVTQGARLPVISTAGDWVRISLHNGNEGWISGRLVDIRVYDGSKPIQNIVGFYVLEEGPALPSSYDSFTQNISLLSEGPLFMYQFNENDPTSIVKFGSFTDNYVEQLVAFAHSNNVMIMPVVHNLLYSSGGQTKSRDVLSGMLSTQATRAAAVNNIIALIDRFGFDGVNIDIEDVYLADSSRLSQFYVDLSAAMKRRGYFLSASVPSRIRDYPPFNPFSEPFDYATIGAVVDQFVVMLYNEHGWAGSEPGSAVSSPWMTKVLSYALTKMPANKIVAAISVFGYDFNLTTGVNRYVSHASAIALANRYNSTITFDEDTLTPTFSYTDSSGNKHEVWFENAQSTLSKIKLAWQLGISGVALWRLGMEDPEMWPRMSREITVRRIIY
jgi:spore germination protein